MFHRALLAAMALAGWARLEAQPAVNAVRVITDPEGAIYSVTDLFNTTPYNGSATLMWPTASKWYNNVPDLPPPGLQSPGSGIQYTLTKVESNLGPIALLPAWGGITGQAFGPVTASPELKWIKLTFNVSYLLR